ncbi:MAG: DUF4826 family protein [Candidatus Hydrogenedentes bacterium]|nr:DUF4826 family protein [Candidatus Hydrogenedentota bacterium]
MSDSDNRDEETWCAIQRLQVIAYLEEQGLHHGDVGEWPAWHLAPYVSVWAIDSLKSPGWVGWWAICGDLPTDYISAGAMRHPRDAVRGIANRWLEAVTFLQKGQQHPDFTFENQDAQQLATLLETRAKTLREWTENDTLWPE